MGIGGHILGEKKLRQLSERSGLLLDRAYRRGQDCEGRIVDDGRCEHYEIDYVTGEWVTLTDPTHWASCPKSEVAP